ncbi:MAG: CHRD domain-containing protein [Candidatus Binatia bacterium]
MSHTLRRRRSVRVAARAVRVGPMLCATIAFLALGGTALATFIDFRATVEQAQETPPSGSASVWTGTFQLDTFTSMVSFNITQTGAPLGTPELFSHVHRGAIGVPGPIAFGLPGGNPKIGSYGPLSAAQIIDMKTGQHYVNIHSGGFPSGEIRGQILPLALTPLDHFQCYKIKKDVVAFPPTVSAADQFAATTLELKKPFLWCNPVSKNGEPVYNIDEHLLCYKVKGPNLALPIHLQSVNQFGIQTLFAKKPFVLCVPGDKTLIP